jgi:hypothetical protein
MKVLSEQEVEAVSGGDNWAGTPAGRAPAGGVSDGDAAGWALCLSGSVSQCLLMLKGQTK